MECEMMIEEEIQWYCEPKEAERQMLKKPEDEIVGFIQGMYCYIHRIASVRVWVHLLQHEYHALLGMATAILQHIALCLQYLPLFKYL